MFRLLLASGGLASLAPDQTLYLLSGWLRGTVVERRSVTGELSLSYARPAADGWPLMCVNRPLQGQTIGLTQPFILSRSISELWAVIGCALPRSGGAIWWMFAE